MKLTIVLLVVLVGALTTVSLGITAGDGRLQSKTGKNGLKKKKTPGKKSNTNSLSTGLLFYTSDATICSNTAFTDGTKLAVLAAVSTALTGATATQTSCSASRRKLEEMTEQNHKSLQTSNVAIEFTVTGTLTSTAAAAQSAFTSDIGNQLAAASLPEGTSWTGTASIGPTGSTPVYTTAEPTWLDDKVEYITERPSQEDIIID